MPLFAWAIVFMVAAAFITAITTKPPAGPQAGKLSDFDFPQADEGTPETVFFGDVWSDDFFVLWYGNLRTKKIKSSSKK